MVDYYLEHPEELKGQPKRTIGDYIEQNGILVPRRFDSLAEAKKSGLKVIARSEHSQDYNGASGLLESLKLHCEPFSKINPEEEIKEEALKESPYWPSDYKEYCNLLGLDLDRFKQEVSFSFWEFLGGYNRIVIADNAIKGRYHIITLPETGFMVSNYSIVDNNSISQEFWTRLTPEQKEGLPELIDFYERIRNLSRFDPNHCPLMEIQTLNGKNYFLQYHRTRDFKPTQFTLERELYKGEIEVPFVRGATSPEGMNCRTIFFYFEIYSGIDDSKVAVSKQEEGSFDLHYCKAFSEIMVRKRKLQVNTYTNNGLEYEFHKFSVSHCSRSKLFKPEVSIMVDWRKLIEEKEHTNRVYSALKKREDAHMDLNVISDGKRAIVKRL